MQIKNLICLKNNYAGAFSGQQRWGFLGYGSSIGFGPDWGMENGSKAN